MLPSRKRIAFTLIELLVVVGVIGVLAALLMVAIQKTRDSAAQVRCTNNLKQVASAALSYSEVNGTYAPGYSRQTQAGVLMYLLPYIEQQNVNAQLPTALTKTQGGNWFSQLPNGGLGAASPVSARIASFECPAASLYDATYANGTVQYETLGGIGSSTTQMTLRQMLASTNPTIVAQGQQIANDLNQIYYAAWAAQSLVFTWDNWGATNAQTQLALDGGSVTVTGGTAGQFFWNGNGENFTSGAAWTAAGNFVVNGQRYDINFNEANLFLNMIGGNVYDSSADMMARNYLNAGIASYDGSIDNERALLARNSSAVGNNVAQFTIPVATSVLPQNNPLFWAYYDATYSATQTFTVAGTTSGFTLYPNNPPDSTMGRTSYVANAGMYAFNSDSIASGNSRFSKGPYYPDSATLRDDIVDGLSNTIAFGESLGGAESMSRSYALTWMGAGVMPSYWDCQTPSNWFTFGSPHAGGVNFAFCDGSVRSISKVAGSPADSASTTPTQINTPRWTVFQYLAGIQDGAVPDVSKLD